MGSDQKLTEFVKLVADMRTAQTEFFALKKSGVTSKTHLERAKLLEHRVDAFIRAESESSAILQKTLFS